MPEISKQSTPVDIPSMCDTYWHCPHPEECATLHRCTAEDETTS